ncbi:MAG: autotransporter-associated beta strand repeat-containing protein [Planctomycetaceae bacterium]
MFVVSRRARLLLAALSLVGFPSAALRADTTFDSGTMTLSTGTDFGPKLFVGYVGTATLEVVGGVAASSDAWLGFNDGSNGSVTVSGGTWISREDLTVGRSGTGILTINGGLVTVGGTLSQGAAGTISLNSGGTLRIGAGNTGGVLGVSALTNHGTLIFDRSNGSTYSGIIGGSGAVTKQGVGELVLSGSNTYTGTTSVNQGTLRVTNGGALQSSPIVVQTGGTLALPNTSRLVLTATSLSVDQATGGTLDIGKGRIDIATGATEADLRADLIAGRSGGTWSGSSGIVTTGGKAGAATQPVVGYRVFATGAATVAWAAFGDVNLDGRVDSTDISLINGGGRFNQWSPATWVQGDFTYDGIVNSTDISLINGSRLYGTGSYLPVVSVPEPSTWVTALAGLTCATWLASRRRGTRRGAERSSSLPVAIRGSGHKPRAAAPPRRVV